MSDKNDEKFSGDETWQEVRVEVEAAWSDVFKVVNTVLHHHDRFGYELIERKIDPKFPDILLSVKVMEAILDAIFAENKLDYDLSRLMLNAKQQINRIELVVTALKHDKREDYEAAMAALRNQAQF